VDHLFNSSEGRLARVLMLLASFPKEDERSLRCCVRARRDIDEATCSRS